MVEHSRLLRASLTLLLPFHSRSRNTSAVAVAEPEVSSDEFADSDESGDPRYSEAQTQEAELIYLVIQEYTVPLRYRFSEDFGVVLYSAPAGSSVPPVDPAQPRHVFNASQLSIPNQPIPNQPIPNQQFSQGLALQTPAFNLSLGSASQHTLRSQNTLPTPQLGPNGSADLSASFTYPDVTLLSTHSASFHSALLGLLAPRLEHPLGRPEHTHLGRVRSGSSRGLEQPLPQRSPASSLSSGELLAKLARQRQRPKVPSPEHSTDSSGHQQLTAGVVLQTALPVMLYLVQDRQYQSRRWLAYDHRHGRAPDTSAGSLALETDLLQAPSVRLLLHSWNYPDEAEVQRPDTARRPLHLPRFSKLSSLSSLSRSSLSGGPSRHLAYARLYLFSDLLGRPIPETGPLEPPPPPRGPPPQPAPFDVPYVPSPPPLVTRVSLEKLDMFGYARATWRTLPKQAQVPWSQWTLVMACALVAVPVFFFVAFGLMDNRGLVTAWGGVPSEKHGAVTWRYHRRYTRLQRMLSFALGVVWVFVVVAMLCVGFGVGLTK